VPFFTALLATACETEEQIEEALMLLNVALQMVESTGGRWLAAELNRQKGQLQRRRGNALAA